MRHRIELEEEGHVYTVDGAVKPSITQILSAVKVELPDGSLKCCFDYGFLSEIRAQQVMARGTWVADLVAWRMTSGGRFARGARAMIARTWPGWWPYYLSFEVWMAQAGTVIPLIVEQIMYSEMHDFCGRPDLIMGWRGELWTTEIKTGHVIDDTAYQTAAQNILLREHPDYPMRGKLHRRMALELHGDGSIAKPVVFPPGDEPHDRATFLAMRRVYGLHAEGRR